MPVIYYESLDSTNDAAKFLKPAEKALVIASRQTNGRGRGDHVFFSPRGGLYFSFIFKDDGSDQHLLTLKAAAAVCGALRESSGADVKIKWVNDLFLDEKKICGILCEHVPDYYVVGIGINSPNTVFPEELVEIAGGIEFKNSEILIVNIIKYLENHASDADILNYCRNHFYLAGKTVWIKKGGAQIPAFVNGIDDRGRLVVDTELGTEYLDSVQSVKY